MKKHIWWFLLIIPITILIVAIYGYFYFVPTKVNLYCIGSLKGSIKENGINPGVAKIKGHIEGAHVSDADICFLSTGDTFQGTYDSSISRGKALARILPEMDCEAMALGNHEFDWGLDILRENKKVAGKTAFLAANVYNYDRNNDQILDFAKDLADEYKIIEKCGKKIGIIGYIDPYAITSINSPIVDDLIFVDPIEVILPLANRLKAELECEAVILLAHQSIQDFDSVLRNSITQRSYVTNRRYVDAVFTNQRRGNDSMIYNGVPFIESEGYGRTISRITLDFKNDGDPVCLSYGSEKITPSATKPDQTITSLINKYIDMSFIDRKNLEIGRITGIREMSRQDVGRLLALATYDALPKEHKDTDIIINNGADKNLFPENELTSGQIFDSLPYTNKTLVVEVRGKDILNLFRRYKYYAYYAKNPLTISEDKTYKIAIVDYVLYHKNEQREYDNFPSFNGNIIYEITEYPNEIVENYLYFHPIINYTTEIFKCPCFSNIRNLVN